MLHRFGNQFAPLARIDYVTPLTTHTDIVTRFPLRRRSCGAGIWKSPRISPRDEYEQVEPEAWEQLQVALGHLDAPAPLTVD